MKILVYVEGPGDRDALAVLLTTVIQNGRARGVGVSFLPQQGKARIFEHVPCKAANHLKQNPADLLIALPDLYPMSGFRESANAHSSFAEMEALLRGRFERAADRVRLPKRSRSRFLVHRLKHDLEALLLAAPDALRSRLNTDDEIVKLWRERVEDQDDEKPPKRIVESLFLKYRNRRYTDTVDAPWILGKADLVEVLKASPKEFGRLVASLNKAIFKASR